MLTLLAVGHALGTPVVEDTGLGSERNCWERGKNENIEDDRVAGSFEAV